MEYEQYEGDGGDNKYRISPNAIDANMVFNCLVDRFHVELSSADRKLLK